jgi:hypothetical protein
LLRRINITRYVTPLREGGSLPAIVEGDDLGTYVLKFRGAGQGRKALVAEIIAGEIGRKLGLPVPEIAIGNLDATLARSEPDPEIQDLIRASEGANLAIDYLPGSLGFDPLASPMDSTLASRILWFDALTTNVDRTPHNTNLLLWHGKVWLIDHGASLYFHHAWKGWREKARLPFTAAKDHVLLPFASEIKKVDGEMAASLPEDTLREILHLVPDEWLEGEPGFENGDAVREAYFEYLSARLGEPREWVHALEEAHVAAL